MPKPTDVASTHVESQGTLFDPAPVLDARIDAELFCRAFARYIASERRYQAVKLLMASGGRDEAVEDLVEAGWRPAAARREMDDALDAARAVAEVHLA